MSLLLDARKKILGMSGTTRTPSATAVPQNNTSPSSAHPSEARNIGKNLFAAKSEASTKSSSPNKNLLFALVATVLVLAGGWGYLSYMDVDNPPLTPAHRTLADAGALTHHAVLADEKQLDELAPLADEPMAETRLVADMMAAPTEPQTRWPKTDSQAQVGAREAVKSSKNRPAPTSNRWVQAGQTAPTDGIDPLLAAGYQAYQMGDWDVAQKAYLAMLGKDSRNRDALLGLAAIAQQHDDMALASHYYQRVLKIDPRDPVANAALSSLTSEEGNSESRLKTLLREQPNAAPLHFALGNQYAAESRWSEAQQAYFNAHTCAPNNPEFALNLAISLDHLGQVKPALQYYQRALQLDQGHDLDRPSITLRIQELSH